MLRWMQPTRGARARSTAGEYDTSDNPDTGAKASLLNCIDRRGRAAPIVRGSVRSGKRRRRACLGVGTCPGTEQVRGCIEPNHGFGVTPGHNYGGLRRVDRRAGVSHAANRTAAVMGAGLAGLIVGNRGRIAMANDGRVERIGCGNAGRPGCADRRKNLHQQRNQDDWKQFPQPPAHDPTSPTSSINHARSWESSSGSQGRDDDAADALFLTQLSPTQPEVAKHHSFRRLLEF